MGRGIEAESERPKGQLEVEREYRKFRRSANSITGHSSFLTPPKAVSVILGRGRYIIILKGEKKKGKKEKQKNKTHPGTKSVTKIHIFINVSQTMISENWS